MATPEDNGSCYNVQITPIIIDPFTKRHKLVPILKVRSTALNPKYGKFNWIFVKP